MDTDVTLKTAFEWCDLLGVAILDPDGWRHDKKSMYDLISREEFNLRMAMSTVSLTSVP